MKCIVIETSPERTNAHTVTNEDGTPHVYATISEARAELKANGYSYNRENQRYYIKGTEYRAYIIREDSEEYADAITTEAHDRAARALAAAQRATDAETAAADADDLEEPAPIYQRYELLAYLGEPEDYDVEAIEAEATAFTADGAQVWSAFGEDLAAIAERHELVTYYAI